MILNWKKRLAVVSGNAFEFYDIAVFAAIAPFISHIFKANGVEQSDYVVWGIFALRFILRPVGGYVISRIADKQGYKKALILTSSLTGAATLGMSLLPTESDNIVLVFLLLQMVQAFSFGGEYPAVINYLVETSKPHERSRISSMIVASSIVGVITSLLIVQVLILYLSESEMNDFGWRIPLVIGAVNIMMSFWFRARLPNVQVIEDKKKTSLSLGLLGKVFLISTTGAIIFYIQNLSSSFLEKNVQISYFSLLNSILLFVLILLVGWLTDRYSATHKVFKYGLFSSVILLFPLYYLLNVNNTLLQVIVLALISLIAAMVLANLAAILFSSSTGDIVSLGIGYNVALSIFGGLSPLIVKVVSSYSISYVGLYAAVAALPALIALTICERET